MFEWLQRLAADGGRSTYAPLVENPVDEQRWSSTEAVADAIGGYWDEHGEMLIGAGARSPQRFVFDRSTWRVSQIVHDPADTNEWRIEAQVDVDASVEQGRAVLRLVDIRRA